MVTTNPLSKNFMGALSPLHHLPGWMTSSSLSRDHCFRDIGLFLCFILLCRVGEERYRPRRPPVRSVAFGCVNAAIDRADRCLLGMRRAAAAAVI